MLKFSFKRERDKDFKHIAHGLIPAASIAPKPAVPRTPPPRSPNPSPERPRSALAAAILSSSLTGQTWAIPPAIPRSFSESGLSESAIFEPNISTALYTRDRWSEDLARHPHLSSPDHSEEEVENESDKEEHVYQSLDRQENWPLTEPVYSLPIKLPKTSAPQPDQMSERRESSPDLIEETSIHSAEGSCESSKNKAVRRSRRKKEVVASMPPTLTPDHTTKSPKYPMQMSPESSERHGAVQKDTVWKPGKKTKMADEQNLLEERLRRLEQEIRDRRASSNRRSSAGSQAELQSLRQHAQELVDENDALKLTVHRLTVELSQYQTCFRPLSKQELDMKYLSPLLLAYEDRMSKKDTLLRTTEEEVKRLRAHVEKVIKENERLHHEITKIGGVSQKDCHQLQQQAFLVLQENQVLIDQLEAQDAKAKASHSRHHSEVSKLSKQLMLLEVEKQQVQEDLEKSRADAQKNTREVQALQARLKDAITWDEHCSIAGKLRRQLEHQESSNKSEMEKLLLRLSSLQEENRSLAVDKANLSADFKRAESELELKKQANRKAERRMSVLKRQKEECVLQEEKTRHYMGAVLSAAEHISKERDQLLHMASVLQQEKQGFVSRIVSGTVRFGKLQEMIKVYRRQASTRLGVLEEAAEGRTASYQREILHLQRLLRERQEAEERLLQSKREVEEELEVVWQAATRENQQMRETLFDSKIVASFDSQPPDEAATSSRHQPLSPQAYLFTSHQSPGIHGKVVFKSDSDQRNSSSDEKHKNGLDFYC